MDLTLNLILHKYPEEKPEKSGEYLLVTVWENGPTRITTSDYSAEQEEFGAELSDGTWVSSPCKWSAENIVDVLWCEVPDALLNLNRGDTDV